MRHLYLTNKNGTRVVIHVEDLREAFPAADEKHTVCVLRIQKREGGDTYVLVKESVESIYEELTKLTYKEVPDAKKEGPIKQ